MKDAFQIDQKRRNPFILQLPIYLPLLLFRLLDLRFQSPYLRFQTCLFKVSILLYLDGIERHTIFLASAELTWGSAGEDEGAGWVFSLGVGWEEGRWVAEGLGASWEECGDEDMVDTGRRRNRKECSKIRCFQKLGERLDVVF